MENVQMTHGLRMNGPFLEKLRTKKILGDRIFWLTPNWLKLSAKSFRKLPAHSQILFGSTHKVIKTLKFHSYYILHVHKFEKLHREKRILYYTSCQSCLDNHGITKFEHVFFTDEAWFHFSVHMNSQDTCIWSTETPHVFHKSRCTVRKIVCSIFFETTMCQNFITPFIALHEDNERNCWLVAAGRSPATYHRFNEKMHFLYQFFGKIFISKGLWPPRSRFNIIIFYLVTLN